MSRRNWSSQLEDAKPHPYGSVVAHILAGEEQKRRSSIESLNRRVEDTLYWNRAHSVGARAQEADLLGFGVGLNALSWSRHRQGQPVASAA